VRAIWPPRSLSVKLGLVLFAIVAAALGIVYLAVVPRLESRLVGERYRELQRAAPSQARRRPASRRARPESSDSATISR
jgi:hypothetical protein